MGRHHIGLASPVPTEFQPSSQLKRKRGDTTDTFELEVDVHAPEPPSKKARRKAKRDSVTVHPRSIEDVNIKRIDNLTDDDHEPLTAHVKEHSKRTEHGVWIGNLPWTTTKADLRSFFCENAKINDECMARVYLPTPGKASSAASQQKVKARNKGFAYVDFTDEDSLKAALALSDTFLAERRVLIKNSKDFEGRPEPAAEKATSNQRSTGHPPNTRIFVGNLGFDLAREDLCKHFEQCGGIADMQIATFEDSGKCKGYAWISFDHLGAAEAAVRGWITIKDDVDADAEEDSRSNSKEHKPKKSTKPRRWWVNQLFGRALRIEFAEPKSLRYTKRFGNEADSGKHYALARGRQEPEIRRTKHDVSKDNMRCKSPKKIDVRNVKPGAALAEAPRLNPVIVESLGKKIVFH